MIQNQKTQLLIAVLLLFAAGGLFFRQWRARGPAEPMIYFYDQSAEELFAAPQSAVPPIQGIDDQEQDAVRAVVISRTGSRKKDDLEIVYLEKYSPEMKAQFEARKAGAPAEAAGGDLPRPKQGAHLCQNAVRKTVAHHGESRGRAHRLRLEHERAEWRISLGLHPLIHAKVDRYSRLRLETPPDSTGRRPVAMGT